MGISLPSLSFNKGGKEPLDVGVADVMLVDEVCCALVKKRFGIFQRGSAEGGCD